MLSLWGQGRGHTLHFGAAYILLFGLPDRVPNIERKQSAKLLPLQQPSWQIAEIAQTGFILSGRAQYHIQIGGLPR